MICVQKPPRKKGVYREIDTPSKRLVIRLSNSFPNGDSSFTIQVKMLLPGLICGVAYVIARTYFLVEDFIPSSL